jgi:propanediol dehydratase small subunit
MNERAFSGRPIDELSLAAVLNDELSGDDVRIHPDALRGQARVAEQHGNPQLGQNLLRAAELTMLSDAELLEVYEALRPGRSTRSQLESVAVRLESAGAELCAALVREAADAYGRRGVIL